MASGIPVSPGRDSDQPADVSQTGSSPKVHPVKWKRPELTTSQKSDKVSHRILGDSGNSADIASKDKPRKVVKGFSSNRLINDPRSLTADALEAVVEKKGGAPFLLSIQKASTGEEHLVTKSISPTSATIVGKLLGKVQGKEADSDKPETILAFLVKAFNEFSNDPHGTLEDAKALIGFYDFIEKWSEEGSQLDPKMKEQLKGLKEGLEKQKKSVTLPNAVATARACIKYEKMDLAQLRKMYDAGIDSKDSYAKLSQPEKIGFLKVFFDKLGPDGTLALVIEQTEAYETGNKETAFRGNDDYSLLIKMFLSLHLQRDFQESRGFKDLLKIAQAAAQMREVAGNETQQETKKQGTVPVNLLNQAWGGVVRDLQLACEDKSDVQKFLSALYDKCKASGLNPEQMVVNIVFLRLLNPLITNEILKKGQGSNQLLELSKAFQNAVNFSEDEKKDKASYTAQFVQAHKNDVLTLGRTLAKA